MNNLGHDLGCFAAGRRRVLLYSEGFVRTVSTAKLSVMEHDLWPNQIFLGSEPQELRFGMDQTLIQMGVLTTGFGDPMVKFEVMVD